MKKILPGSIGLTKIEGLLGWWVGLGQHLTGDSSPYTHAFIVLDDNTVMAAQPGGAKTEALSRYKDKAVYLDIPLTEGQRRVVVNEARMLRGVPYSFIDYMALALARFGVKPQWLRRYISNKGHMICSQLVDEVYRRAGVKIFKDGRLPQDVTPGDLANWAIEHEWLNI